MWRVAVTGDEHRGKFAESLSTFKLYLIALIAPHSRCESISVQVLSPRHGSLYVLLPPGK